MHRIASTLFCIMTTCTQSVETKSLAKQAPVLSCKGQRRATPESTKNNVTRGQADMTTAPAAIQHTQTIDSPQKSREIQSQATSKPQRSRFSPYELRHCRRDELRLERYRRALCELFSLLDTFSTFILIPRCVAVVHGVSEAEARQATNNQIDRGYCNNHSNKAPFSPHHKIHQQVDSPQHNCGRRHEQHNQLQSSAPATQPTIHDDQKLLAANFIQKIEQPKVEIQTNWDTGDYECWESKLKAAVEETQNFGELESVAPDTTLASHHVPPSTKPESKPAKAQLASSIYTEPQPILHARHGGYLVRQVGDGEILHAIKQRVRPLHGHNSEWWRGDHS